MEATGKAVGAKRSRGDEGGPPPKAVKLQDLQATVRSLVQQSLSVPGTAGISSMGGR